MEPIFVIRFIEFENRSTINLLYVYFEFEFPIKFINCSNLSKQSIPWFLLQDVQVNDSFHHMLSLIAAPLPS